MNDIPIIEVTADIKLGQFLKYANLAEDGVEARELIQGGDVLVDGEVEIRRGCRLRDGSLVEVEAPDGTYAAKVRIIG